MVDELAQVFSTRERAITLLAKVAAPAQRIRSFDSMSAVEYWNHVLTELEQGLIGDPDPLRTLLGAAAEWYPGNRVLGRLLDTGTAQTPAKSVQRRLRRLGLHSRSRVQARGGGRGHTAGQAAEGVGEMTTA